MMFYGDYAILCLTSTELMGDDFGLSFSNLSSKNSDGTYPLLFLAEGSYD